MTTQCTTPGCPGDWRYVAPGRGHNKGCTYPLPEPQDIAALRETAEAATPGVWRAAEGDLEGKPMLEYFRTLLGNREKDGTSIERLFLVLAPNDIDPEVGAEVIPATTGDGPRAEANAAFIAAASPDVVLALLSEVERGRALRTAVEALAEDVAATAAARRTATGLYALAEAITLEACEARIRALVQEAT